MSKADWECQQTLSAEEKIADRLRRQAEAKRVKKEKEEREAAEATAETKAMLEAVLREGAAEEDSEFQDCYSTAEEMELAEGTPGASSSTQPSGIGSTVQEWAEAALARAEVACGVREAEQGSYIFARDTMGQRLRSCDEQDPNRKLRRQDLQADLSLIHI